MLSEQLEEQLYRIDKILYEVSVASKNINVEENELSIQYMA